MSPVFLLPGTSFGPPGGHGRLESGNWGAETREKARNAEITGIREPATGNILPENTIFANSKKINDTIQ
jgi:hypothetical protein